MSMKHNLKRYIGLLLVIVMVAGMMPASALADTFTSNVIGPLTLEEEEVDFGEPDPSADLESEGDFIASLHEVPLKGLPYNQRLLAVAETQLGYTESAVNFVVKEDEVTGKKAKFGITRYGQWYGLPYEDWCAMFISFCLHYGQVPNYLMPADSGAFTWVNRLQSMGLFRWRSEYTPKPGDLIFFDNDLSGQSDHVGIVSSLFTVDGVDMVETIEGNHSKTVEKFSYPLISLEIQGYGVMSEEIPADELESVITTEYVSGSDTYRVTMTYTADALIPANAVLVVSEILPGTPEYDAYVAESAGALGWEEGSVSDAKVLDISVFADGVEVQPAAPVNVEMVLVDQPAEDWNVVHFGKEETQVLDSVSEGDSVTFETEGFSVFVFAKSVIEKKLTTTDHNTYKITVTYDSSAGVPEGAQLEVSEIPEDSGEYSDYVSKSENAVGVEEGGSAFVRLFDIKILDADGNKVEISAPVDVKIQLASTGTEENASSAETQVVHFADGEEAGTVVENVSVIPPEEAKNAVELSFETSGFSVFAVIGTITTRYITADGETYLITVTYDKTASIPNGAELAVREILSPAEASEDSASEYDEYVAKTQSALGIDSAGYIRLFDISIVSTDGEKIQPAAGSTVDVRMELADSIGEQLNVVHFSDENDSGTVIEADVDGRTVSFEAEGFSIYVVADTGHYARLIYRFHDTDGAVISTQYVKKYVDPDTQETVYETLYDPGLVPEYGQRLVGWAYSPDERDLTKIYQLVDLDIHTVETLQSADFEDEFTVDVYAVMDDAWYLRYMDVDEKGVVKILKTERIPRDAADKHVDINFVTPLPEGSHYQGWYDPVLNQVYSEHLYEGEHEQFDTIPELNRHLDLYLKLDNRVWLVFDANAGGSGSGAAYTPPQMMYTNADPAQITVKPDDPTWKGYTFTGWNTQPDGSGEDWLVVDSRTYDADGNLLSTQYSTNKFGEEMKNDVILYAQWTPDDNFYRIAYWRQKETDRVVVSDSEKKYDFFGYREIRSGIKTGDTVSATANDRNYAWVAEQLGKKQGDENKFNFNTANSDLGAKSVAGDGSTVLNMYFDRAVMTFVFDQNFYWYTETTDLSGTLYGYVDGKYVELTKGEPVTTYYYTMQYAYTAANDENNNRYGLVDGAYVPLTRESYNSIDGGATEYTGKRYRTARNDNNPPQYGVVNDQLVALTRTENSGCGGTSYTWSYNGQAYDGIRYVEDDAGNIGFVNGSMHQIEQHYRYTCNNNLYTGTRYARSNSGAGYTGTRYDGVNGSPVTGHDGQQYGIDGNGGYVSLNRISNSSYSSFTYADEDGVHNYTGTFYTQGTTNQLRGLYGSQMKPGEWPDGVWQFANSSANSYNSNSRTTLNAPWTSYTISTAAYEYNRGTSPYTSWHLYSAYLPTGVNVVYWRQDAEGNYTDAIRTTGGANNTLTIANNKFYGFTALGYEYGGTGGTPNSSGNSGNLGWHDLTNLGTGTASLTMRASSGDINIYYQRDTFSITFQSNDADSTVRSYPEPVLYEKNLGFLKNWYTPSDADGREGYFFAGWYTDANFTKPFNFENEEMPHNDIVLYGKWDTYRARIVLVPTVNNAHNDEVSFANDQALAFRVNYNESVSDANINSAVATRTGYKLVGWYTTPDFQDGTEWNFNTHINSQVPAVNMNYQQTEDWENNTYGDNDGEHDNVEAILKLYAKWEFDFSDDDLFIEYEVPESYVKRDASGNLLTHIPQDNNKYTYNEGNTSVTASIKEAPENYLDAFTFDKWEVMDSSNIPTGVSFNANDMANIADALPVIQTRTLTDDNGETRTIKVIVLRATFSKSNNNKGTVVTFDGNGGQTVDNQSDSRTLTLLVNEDFIVPGETGENAFQREGYSLIGWSFNPDTTSEEFRQALADAGETPDVLYHLALQGMFEPAIKVAADNQSLSELNNWDPLSNTVYAVWEPNKFTVSVKKLVEGETMADKTFHFTAQALTEDGFDLFNNQTMKFADVPYGTEFTLKETPLSGYTVKEVRARQTSTADGTKLPENEYIDLEGEDGKAYVVHGDTEIIYTNKLSALPVSLKKVGYSYSGANPQVNNLSGAGFTIYTSETGSEVATDAEGNRLENLSSGNDGVFYTGRLGVGEYYLYETVIPTGYNPPPGRFKLTVGQDGVTITAAWATGAPGYEAGNVVAEPDANTGVNSYTVSVSNTAGILLPSTGGYGTTVSCLVGGLMICFAGLLLIKRKKAY